MYLLDTNICAYLISRRYPQVLERFQEREPSDLFISTLVAAELAAGVANSDPAHQTKNRARLDQFLSRMQLVPWDDKVIWLYAEHKTRLWRAGTRIGDIDLLLGCQALAEGAIFVTNNTREFERIDGLRLENWTA